jgi:hypothetical protein
MSVWMSDCSENIPILKENHPFLLIKYTVLQAALHLFQIRQFYGQESPANMRPKTIQLLMGLNGLASARKRREGVETESTTKTRRRAEMTMTAREKSLELPRKRRDIKFRSLVHLPRRTRGNIDAAVLTF